MIVPEQVQRLPAGSFFIIKKHNLGKEKIIYFNWKFVPGRENRKTPDCRKIDCDNQFQLLKWRQDVRLYFLNWRNVWYTYRYLLKYFPFLGLLVWALSGSLMTGLAIAAFYVPVRVFIYRKISTLDQLEILMPGLIDPQLIPVFGNLPGFNEE